MLKETMTSKERVEAALRLEEVDRTPVGLLPLQGFIYKYLGRSVSAGFKDRLEHPDSEVQSAEDSFKEAVERSDSMSGSIRLDRLPRHALVFPQFLRPGGDVAVVAFAANFGLLIRPG